MKENLDPENLSRLMEYGQTDSEKPEYDGVTGTLSTEEQTGRFKAVSSRTYREQLFFLQTWSSY